MSYQRSSETWSIHLISQHLTLQSLEGFIEQNDYINNIIAPIKAMKRTVEIKTVMFTLNEKNKEKQIHSPSPRKGLARIETSPSQHQFRGSKLSNKASDSKIFRRLSYQSPETRKPLKKEQTNPELKLKRSRCQSQNPARYDAFGEFPMETMVHSRSNKKMSPFLQREGGEESGRVDKKTVTSMNWDEMLQLKRGRMKSQPTSNLNLKNEIMLRVSKKLNFMRKMTIDGPSSSPPAQGERSRLFSQCEGNKLFNFDRLYEHCLKKINKNINVYEKDLGKSKDRKYYQLKVQSSILSTELKSMRKSLAKPREDGQGELGVIGNVIELGKGERAASQRGERACTGCSGRANASGFRKKLGMITRRMEGHNPFKGELHGWQTRHERPDEFQLK